MVLALQHRLLPKTLHAEQLSRQIEWQGTVVPLQQSKPWPALDRPRRAAVSAFGISGTNAHVLLEQAPDAPAVASTERASGDLWPFVLSASNTESLRNQARRLAEHLSTH